MSSPPSGSTPPVFPATRFRDRFLRDPLWRHADFVRLWSARAISQFGTQITYVAIPLYAALALHASPLEMGLIAASGGAPRLALGLLAGAWVDRVRRRPIMIAADIGRALALATIPVAALLGLQSLTLLILVEVISGVLSVFFVAAWAPFLPQIVGRGNLASANSKMLASNSLAQVVGPSLAGALVGTVGGPITFTLNVLSSLWSAFMLTRIRHREAAPAPSPSGRSLRREVREGIHVLIAWPFLRALSGSHATIILAGHLFLAVYPLYMVDTLALSARGVGFIYAAGGAGGLLGSLVTPLVLNRLGTGYTIIWSATLFGLFGLTIPLAVIVPDHALPLVLFAEIAQWMTLVVFQVTEGSLRQAITPDHLLGRVGASDYMLTNGLQPLGALLGGLLGEVVGIQGALLIGVAGMFCAGAWVYWSPIRAIRAMPTEPDMQLGTASPANA